MTGKLGSLAAFTRGGWRYVAATDGFTVLEKSTGSMLRYRAGAGEHILGARQPSIPDVAGGSTMDVESRATISAILGALRAHGLIGA